MLRLCRTPERACRQGDGGRGACIRKQMVLGTRLSGTHKRRKEQSQVRSRRPGLIYRFLTEPPARDAFQGHLFVYFIPCSLSLSLFLAHWTWLAAVDHFVWATPAGAKNGRTSGPLCFKASRDLGHCHVYALGVGQQDPSATFKFGKDALSFQSGRLKSYR